jgi:hypothetical protein
VENGERPWSGKRAMELESLDREGGSPQGVLVQSIAAVVAG